MGLYLAILLIVLVLLVQLLKRYPGALCAYALRRLLNCQQASIEGLGWFSLGQARLRLHNGLGLELRGIRVDKLLDWRPGIGPSLNLRLFVQTFRLGQPQEEDVEENGGEEDRTSGSRRTTATGNAQPTAENPAATGASNSELHAEECCAVDSLVLCLHKTESGAFQLDIRFHNSFELTWSPVLHLRCYDIVKAFRSRLSSIASIWKSFSSVTTASPHPTPDQQQRRPSTSGSTLLFNVQSEHPVELAFRLPRKHLLRFIIPSFSLERKATSVGHFLAPNLLVEMDGNIIVNVDRPSLECTREDLLIKVIRTELKHLEQDSNRLWSWSADLLQIGFPYGYCFADAFEEVINCVKWVKLVHGIRPVEFTIDSPLPADVHIRFKKFSLRLYDDPFEIQLQNIYEVQMDEVFERERRKQILDVKIAQLKKEDPFFPKDKIEALYRSLIKKDGQLYVERIRKVRQQQQDRSLFQWSVTEFQLRAFADPTLHGKANVLTKIERFNPESQFSTNDPQFSTLWARAVELEMDESQFTFRDYPLPYMDLQKMRMWGILVGAEQLMESRSMRQQFIHTPAPWGTFSVNRNMCPLKFFYDLKCEISDLKSTYGPCWEPCLTMISQCWALVNAPSRDPSEALPFWDKLRLLLHGRFAMSCQRLQTSMLASPDPYNDTELVEIVWEDYEFDWLTGEFRIRADVDAFIRTASKYDDSRLLHLPRMSCTILLNWICLGDQHDHHSVQPCAPDKLPEYSRNIGHDSFRAFRSSHVNAVIRFETNPWDELHANRQCPELQLYANTFKCLDFLMKTLMTVNRPIKRGPLFSATATKRYQLSRHLKNVHLSSTLPRFLISYWMSFSSSHGFRVISDNLKLTCASQLLIHSTQSDDRISRRSKIAWKMSHMSAHLENTQIHLYKSKPSSSEDEQLNELNDSAAASTERSSNSSFFVGLSRLIYIRESRTSKKIDFAPEQFCGPKKDCNRTMNNNNNSSDESSQSSGLGSTVHRLTITDLKAAWTIDNRDICLVIAEGVQKAHILRKILNNEALKMFNFGEEAATTMASAAGLTGQTSVDSSSTNIPNLPTAGGMRPLHHSSGSSSRIRHSSVRKAAGTSASGLTLAGGGSPRRESGGQQHYYRDSFSSIGGGNLIDDREMLWRLVDEAETNLVAYSEEIAQNPTDSLNGVALCNMDDVILTNWQIDLLNSQLVLKSSEKVGGFILVTAARASVTQRLHIPVWRHTQLLLKKSWNTALSGMQYFAPVFIAEGEASRLKPTEFHWLNRDVIEEKQMPTDQLHSKVEDFSTTGEAVGGVVVDNSTISLGSSSSLQLQRVASRCSCQLFFCYFSDMLGTEELEDLAITIPTASPRKERGSLGERRCEEVDTFTLKHNILEVCTNSEQYQMCIDILQNLIMFVDPHKTQSEGNRRRMWFELLKKSRQAVRVSIQKMQSDLRELVSVIRALERQAFFLNKEIQVNPQDVQLEAEIRQLQADIDEYKQKLNVLIDELAMMISCYKEKEVEEQVERLKIEQWRQHHARGGNNEDGDDEDEQKSFIARQFEVCFENCIWRLTENDGQISLAEVQIRNFLYTRTARIDNSGDHLLEIGIVKVLNLLPNSKYKETLARLQKPSSSVDVTPSIRVICRELAPVGGISMKEHFEVNIAPMHAQITYRFFEKMMQFFFPGRNIEKEDQQNLDTSDDQQQQQGQHGLSFARRIRGAVVNHSFRTGKAKAAAHVAAIRDEVDKMKERSEKNNMFIYIIIPAVPFLVSYKGNKEKNLEDVDRFNLTFPVCEYHDKNWTWLDLALAIKQRCKRVLLQQFINQKFLRNSSRLGGLERIAVEPIDDEEKKRIILGNTANMLLEKKKRKK